MFDTGDTSERRKHPELRPVFPAIYEALRPFFDPANRWGEKHQEYLAYRTLKEQFPNLSAQDCFVAVATAKRLFAAGASRPAP